MPDVVTLPETGFWSPPAAPRTALDGWPSTVQTVVVRSVLAAVRPAALPTWATTSEPAPLSHRWPMPSEDRRLARSSGTAPVATARARSAVLLAIRLSEEMAGRSPLPQLGFSASTRFQRASLPCTFTMRVRVWRGEPSTAVT